MSDEVLKYRDYSLKRFKDFRALAQLPITIGDFNKCVFEMENIKFFIEVFYPNDPYMYSEFNLANDALRVKEKELKNDKVELE